MAEMTKDCMKPIMPILMRTAWGPKDLSSADNVVFKDEDI